MTIDLIDKEEVYNEDARNTKKRYLDTDGICTRCGCIINAKYEDKCIICSECGGKDLITGKVVVTLRLLLDFSFNDLRELAVLRGCRTGNRARTIIELIRIIHPGVVTKYTVVNESLVRKIIKRGKKSLWYLRDIDTTMRKVYHINIPLVSKDDVNDEVISNEE